MKKQKKKKEVEKGFWRKTYSEIWQYLKESKNYIFILLGLFILIALVGFLFPIFFVEEISTFLKNILEQTKDLSLWQMILFILKNNALGTLFVILLGAIFGLLPLLSCISNGYILGFVSNLVVGEAGFVELWRILPHGIFEFPALIISLGVGFRFGLFMFAKNPKKEFKRRFLRGLQTYLFVVLPILVIAAIIEGSLIMLLG